MNQHEITSWEKDHYEEIVGWEINYGGKEDIIIFTLKDKSKITFKRDKK
jgi:hypothetical protein